VAALHHVEVTHDPRLREIDCGDWTGRSRAEIEAFDADGLRNWATTPSRMRMPNGETLAEAHQRAMAFFAERMPAHAGQTIALITHGAIGQAILVTAMGRSLDDLWLKERLDNCQISRLEWTAQAGLHLIELSDVRHLADVGTLRLWRTTDVEPEPDADVA
jgi:broad specificity phosphatase PhoE